MNIPFIEIVECESKATDKQGEILFIQREDIRLKQLHAVADLLTYFGILRDPALFSSLNWQVVQHGSGSTCAFGLATVSQISVLPLQDLMKSNLEFHLLLSLLAAQNQADADVLLDLYFPLVISPELRQSLSTTRTIFIDLLGGKKIYVDFSVNVAGNKATSFFTRFPSGPLKEARPRPKTLNGRITSLRTTSMDFSDEEHGKIVIDFSPNIFFEALKNRFKHPALNIALTVEGEGDFVKAALNTIDVPAIGSLQGEVPNPQHPLFQN
jgi:hypothetical protein